MNTAWTHVYVESKRFKLTREVGIMMVSRGWGWVGKQGKWDYVTQKVQSFN